MATGLVIRTKAAVKNKRAEGCVDSGVKILKALLSARAGNEKWVEG